MSAISRVQASLASATQETTLALASLNFDFSLFKVEAPPSYQPLGAALSLHRRSAAENGMPHVIARRLGSLFETLLPSTPNLIAAYGTRASEISKSLGARSSRKSTHGPFEKFIGLDGTSIWAAATSGPSAVAAHLLACMLARVWPSAEAVSIWEELVTERKKALIPADDVEAIPTRDVVAAQLQITKEQLAEWDASARAWLRAADTSDTTKKQQKELIDLLSSISVPVDSHPKVYESVCKAWVTALSTIDKLVLGHPYSAQDGAVLVALSSWHLYPDIIVLGSSHRTMTGRDPLLGKGAALTLGLQSSGPEASRGVHWSLSLSHLRYYGSPVLSHATVDSDSGRLTFPQFLQVCLGALIAHWGVPITHIKEAAQLVVSIKSAFSVLVASDGPSPMEWLGPLASAATKFCSAQEQEQNAIAKLVKLGHRRHTILAAPQRNKIFNLHTLDFSCILKSADDQVQFFRVVFEMWARPDVCLVLRSSVPNSPSYRYYVLAGNQTHVREAINQPLACFEDERNITASFTKSSITWENPPDILRHYQETPRPTAGAAAKEKSHWPFKSKKIASASVPTKPSQPLTLEFVCGRTDGVALYCTSGHVADVEWYGSSQLSLRHLIDAFTNNKVDSSRLHQHFMELALSASVLVISCLAVAHAALVYDCMPGATISPKVLELQRPIGSLPWAVRSPDPSGIEPSGIFHRAQAFSCVAFFESGIADGPVPEDLENTMAISSADSLYVAAPLLCDPASDLKPYEIHQVMGNIGRAGLAFLIPPQAPMVRVTESENWRMVNHDLFDGKLENNFQATTLHLGFSGYEIPIALSDHGGRFIEAFFIEAVVSVHDSGRWVADLDVLATLKSPNLFSLIQQQTCQQSSPAGSVPDVAIVSLDNWEEILDPPSSPSVVRAHGNWQARLAAANVSVMRGHPTVLFRDHGCWTCAVKVLERFEMDQMRYGGPYNPYTQDESQPADSLIPTCVFVL